MDWSNPGVCEEVGVGVEDVALIEEDEVNFVGGAGYFWAVGVCGGEKGVGGGAGIDVEGYGVGGEVVADGFYLVDVVGEG